MRQLELTGRVHADGGLQVAILTEQDRREHEEALARLGYGDIDLSRAFSGPARAEFYRERGEK